MNDLFHIFNDFLALIPELDLFQYFIGCLGIFGVVLLVRKIIFA